MNLLRPILAVAVIAIAIVFSGRFSEHHKSDDVFQQLYLHLMPANLVQHSEHGEDHADEAVSEHGDSELLFTLPLPGFLGETFAGIANGIGGLVAGDPHAALTHHYQVDHADGTSSYGIPVTNLQIFQLAAVLLIFILLGGIANYLRGGQADYLTRMFTGFAMYIRDEMVVPVMGVETAKKYLPFFLSIFFFILFMNVMGLVPGSATATASIFITGALAAITLFSIVICGMVVQGPIAFWKNLVPHVPIVLWPLMFFVELVGLFVKPFALMIRLFANMTGGHMVVLSFMGLIFFFAANMGNAAGYGSSPVAVGFAGFIMIIEAFVAMLQAYIFTQLSIIFVNMAIHPEH